MKYLCVITTLAALAGASLGCDRDSNAAAQNRASEGGAAEGATAGAAGPSNRIDVPEQVRQNLGITFAKVERRRVASTIRVTGRFELTPSARREYRTPVPGRVELFVEQYDAVEPGKPLYRLSLPDWLKLRQQLQEDLSGAKKAAAELASAEAARKEAQEGIRILQERIGGLAEAGTRRAELDTQLSERKATLPRLEAEANAKRADLEAAQQRFPLTLATAAAMTGLPAEKLAEEVAAPGGGEGKVPRWQTVNEIEVRATAAGVVESLGVTNGTWAEGGGLVISVVDANALRFRAVGLQADLGRLRTGAPASIVHSHGVKGGETLNGKLSFGLEASPDTRTLDLLITPPRPSDWIAAEWARAGVSAFAELVIDETAEPESAIPLAAVIQDGLEQVYFRRDPQKPDVVVRTVADLGISDGRWVVIASGVKPADEVVVGGVYELKLASAGAGSGTAGGHFHADGSFHAGKDEKK